MRICIFGAGVIGGFVAAHLARVNGLEVSVVASGAHLAALRERALRVVTPLGEIAARVQATDRAEDLWACRISSSSPSSSTSCPPPCPRWQRGQGGAHGGRQD